MSPEPDLHIHYNRMPDRFQFFISLIVFVICLSQRADDRPFPRGYGLFAAMGLLAVGCALYSGARLLDTNVKLSLFGEGLKDHRTGLMVKWADIRAVRLNVQTMNGSLQSALVHLDVSNKEDGEREMSVDIRGLELSHEEIVKLIQNRRIAAIEAKYSSPEAIMESLLEEVKGDLLGGIPLSFAANKMTKRGLSVDLVTHLLLQADDGKIVRCRQCYLEYHASVERCGVCGSILSRSIADPI